MTQETPETTKELFASVSKELDNDGRIMVKYAFFSNNFALAVRVPWQNATELVSGLREQTLAITKQIMQEEKTLGKPGLEVVKEVPDALRNKARREGI